MKPAGSSSALQRRRERAIELLKDQHQPSDVAATLGVDRRSVRRWNAAHRKQGAKALQAKPASGRPSKLSEEDRARLQQTLLQGAQAAGFPTALWTCPRIAKAIERQFGVQYHVDHIGRLMRALGWTPQKPTRRAEERDEQAITNWVKQDWPRVKKTPRA